MRIDAYTHFFPKKFFDKLIEVAGDSLRLEDPSVKAKLRERYGENIPLDEPVISPAAMFASPELETVLQQ